MELDDLKKAINKERVPSLDCAAMTRIKSEVDAFRVATRRRFFLESTVALFAFTLIVFMMVMGPVYYPNVIGELFPGLVSVRTPELNGLMYAGMAFCAVYCVYVPVKLYRAQQIEASLSWTVSSRVEQAILNLEQQSELWSKAHVWSLVPATVIGILFFWGLQYSLTLKWLPTPYLMGYLVFVALNFIGGIGLRNKTLERDIKPLLVDLYRIKSELKA